MKVGGAMSEKKKKVDATNMLSLVLLAVAVENMMM